MANTIEVKVPDIGDYTDVPVIEVLVGDGDTVEAEQPLLVLESDKATLEVPAPAAGVVRGFQIKVGDKVSEGNAICSLETGEEKTGETKAPESSPAGEVKPEQPSARAEGASNVSAPPSSASRSEAPTVSRQEIRIPDIGNYTGVPVIEVLVADGDTVEAEQPLLVLESDKATLEVPSPAAGVVSDLKVKVGDKVSEGDLVCSLAQTGERSGQRGDVEAKAPASSSAADVKPAQTSARAEGERDVSPLSSPVSRSEASPVSRSSDEVPYAGPATRKFARELGVDLKQVKGSGPRGRIVVGDVQGFVKQRMAQPQAAAGVGGSGIPPIPPVDFSKFGPVEHKPLARIRKLSSQFLHRSWVNVPHVTQTDEADITELEDFRRSMSQELAAAGGPKLTVLPFMIKAVAAAMKTYPEFNSSLAPDGESLIMKGYCNIGFAADTPNGLVVPVIKDVWNKGLTQLADESAALASRARDGKLKPDEMSGGCFSISSLGGIGGSHFTPIVNAPEVGILGVSKAQMKPVWDGSAFQPRLMCPLSLSYDHRVIDGAYAARFIVHLVRLLSDMRRLAL